MTVFIVAPLVCWDRMGAESRTEEHSMHNVRVVNVAIVGPEDAEEAKKAIEHALDAWTAANSFRDIRLVARRWPRDTAPVLRRDADGQQVTNEQLIMDADIIIAVFKSRLGTPTRRNDSGTAEEIDLAFRLHKPCHVYFFDGMTPRGVDMGELMRLLAYRAKIQSEYGGLTGVWPADPQGWYLSIPKVINMDLTMMGLGRTDVRIPDGASERSTVETGRKQGTPAVSAPTNKTHDIGSGEQSADSGQFEIITYTFAGDGPTSTSPDKTEDWYRKGSYAETHDKDWKKAATWYRKAAEAGHVKAQCQLGWFYRWGLLTKTRDTRSAEHWYRMAAEQGDAEGQRELGKVLADTSRDGEAVQWYRKAAEQGDCDAQRYLGECYEKGKGVKADPEKAAYWYHKAADQGVGVTQHEAAFSLGKLYEEHRDADGWSVDAAKDNPGRNGVRGFMYQHSAAGKADAQQAIHWYRKTIDLEPKDKPDWAIGRGGLARMSIAQLIKRYPDLA